MIRRLHLLVLFLILFCFPVSSAAAAQSTDLSTRRTNTPDGYITDYIDSNGVITLATDKGYATIQRVVENGQTTEEYYFDESGAPIKVSGAYGRINLYEDDRCTQITYVDADGQPMLNSSGYAIVRRVVDDRGRVLQEMYFDTAGEPVSLSGGQGGLRRETFDEADRVTQFTYLDTDGTPVMLKNGYSTIKRAYDEYGRAETDMYFDLAGEQIMRSEGYFGMRYIRDDAGKHIGTTYLDRDGQPMACDAGYVTVVYEHDDWNNVVQYAYYDAAGQPMALHRGQYGQRIEYERKERIRAYYIDAQGKEMFLLDQFLQQNLWLNIAVAIVLTACASFLPQKLQWGLLGLYALFILYMTLIVRESGEQKSEFELFWSYKQLFTNDGLSVQIIQNVLLFVPFGALVCALFGPRPAILAAIILSALIEGTQLFFGLGLCELDDVFSNGMGGGLGTVVMWGMLRVKVRTRSSQKQ